MLLSRLDYHAPELLAAALTPVLDAGADHDVLDAGCGTGLCGPLLKPHARSLTGVDLSPRMLAKARLRCIYDTLVEAELGRFLRDHAAAFDVVASADTLCYFGDLAPVIDAAASALRSRGWLAFTVERADDVDDYRINPHGRYSHARRFVERLLVTAGFDELDVAPAVLRREAGAQVDGWVVRARLAQ
jgi:predicted TPR repeat methyltransferase